MLWCIVEFSSVIKTGTGQEAGSDETVGYSRVKALAMSCVNPLNN